MAKIINNDIYEWTPEQLTSEMLNLQMDSDYLRIREIIFLAEDTDFTVAQSKLVAPWLISFAQICRDSKNIENQDAVLSAIRTGASMLNRDHIYSLYRLLEPGHPVETTLVTIKMIGRIFEAQPPSGIDEYQELSNIIYDIAKLLLNSYAITSSKIAAMAQLSIYAIAAMASSRTQQAVYAVGRINANWFSTQVLRKLYKLRNIWITSSDYTVDKEQQEMINKAIKYLESIREDETS